MVIELNCQLSRFRLFGSEVNYLLFSVGGAAALLVLIPVSHSHWLGGGWLCLPTGRWAAR